MAELKLVSVNGVWRRSAPPAPREIASRRRTLVLEGIAPSADAAHPQPVPLQRLADALRPGERLFLRFRLGQEDGCRPLAFAVDGEVPSQDSDACLEDLVERLQLILGLEAPWLRFSATAGETAWQKEWRWHARLRPSPSMVGRVGSFGGTERRGGAATPRIALSGPQAAARVELGAALGMLAGRVENGEIEIALEPCLLSEADCHILQATLHAGPVSDYTVAMPEASGLPTAASVVSTRLARWLRAGRGYRLSCWVFASAAVSPALLALLGAAVFGGSATTVDGSDAADAAVELDLRDAFPRGLDLPFMLPAAREFAMLGIGEVFARPADLPRQGLLIGRTAGLQAAEVRISGARDRVTYVIGAAGSGKSTLLFNMALQDMRDDQGVILLDPHGDLFSAVLGAVPEGREDDVVVIDFADRSHAVGLNLLEIPAENRLLQGGMAISELMGIAERLYNMRLAGGPMFEHYCRAALQLLLESDLPDVTLMDLPRVFQDASFRRRLMRACTNPLVVQNWYEIHRVDGDTKLENMGPYVASKFSRFINNPLLRHVVGQPRSSLSFRAAMDEGRIVLVNLAKGLVGDLDSRMAGMLVLSQIFLAAAGRADIPPTERRLVNLYVDEFQSLATPTMAAMLAESRKFGVGFTLAHQSLGQLRGADDMLHAVLGNVATLVALRLGPQDCDSLAACFPPPIRAASLVGLPDHAGIVRLPPQRPMLPPVRFDTLPPMVQPSAERAAEIAERSRQRYARARSEIEACIRARASGETNDSAAVSERR